MLNSKPLVTVVTLTYKKFEYIYETIDSVLNQDYPNIEYIISDDGSENFPKDEIETYISTYKGDNLVRYLVVTAEHNQGIVKNLNSAYRRASGEILMTLSGDDCFYDTHVVDRVVSAFEERQCDVLITRRMACDANGAELRMIPSDTDIHYIEGLNTAHLQHLAFITSEFYDMASGSVMYLRRSFYEEWGGLDERYTLWEDGPFLTKYTLDHVIPTDYGIISIKYRLGGVSSGRPNPLMWKDHQTYNRLERSREESQLPRYARRKVRYICERFDASSKWEIFWLYLKYIDVMFGTVMYELRRRNIHL